MSAQHKLPEVPMNTSDRSIRWASWIERFLHAMVNITVAEWRAILSIIISNIWFDSWYTSSAEIVKYKGITEILKNKIDGQLKPNEYFKQLWVYKKRTSQCCASSVETFLKGVYCLLATIFQIRKSQLFTKNCRNEQIKLDHKAHSSYLACRRFALPKCKVNYAIYFIL